MLFLCKRFHVFLSKNIFEVFCKYFAGDKSYKMTLFSLFRRSIGGFKGMASAERPKMLYETVSVSRFCAGSGVADEIFGVLV